MDNAQRHHPYAVWVSEITVAIRDATKGRIRPRSDLWGDGALLGEDSLGSDVAHTPTIQLLMQTAAYQLSAAVEMHAVWAPQSATPPLSRAALETAGTAAWLLTPDDRQERLTRFLRLKTQEKYDEWKYRRGNASERQANKRLIQSLAQRVGISGGAIDRRFSAEEALGSLELGVDLPLMWSLSSGLTHARRWALHEASSLSGAPQETDEDGFLVLSVPRELFGTWQLIAGRVLDEAVRLWNLRSGLVSSDFLPRLDLGDVEHFDPRWDERYQPIPMPNLR
ncbi:hypothetical protein [Microbacterium sp. IEGM 1404]|uniref:hypothetical protein n=1 Tax=Microbacterium sp. IEGM 1404 TaxID=3047084 RepID=UPI0024B7CEE7|nr:hypothetical protein [Microbacterium sp. IEGM 1404]MDI9890568.1 hypothetical protein [Microbacterium sp. IEGM 1404]